MTVALNLSGRVFGRLLVVERSTTARRHVHWVCSCECGTTVEVNCSNLVRGNTRSCGCLKIDELLQRRITHGMCRSPEYSVWSTMWARCTNPKVRSFKSYGGRGIRVCVEWGSFDNFYADMGPRPFPGAQVDRKDNNGNYSADNCKWSTATQQARNTRATVRVIHGGVLRPLIDVCESLGVNYQRVSSRLRKGWELQRALETPNRFCKKGTNT